MSIKTILIPLDGAASGDAVLATALVVARRFDSHLVGLHVMQRPHDAAPFMFDRLSQKLRSTVMAEAEADAREQAATVRESFEAFCAANDVPFGDGTGAGVSAEWAEEFGDASEVIVRHARMADAVTIARPSIDSGTVRRTPLGRNLQEILLGSGRPVVLVPPRWQARRIEKAAIGWNASLEASRALAMTIPWLAQMQQVSVLVSARREEGARPLLAYLQRHDVKAELRVLETRRRSVGEALLAGCTAAGAEFLVVGGFSHSRARELLFGGVTQHLLTHSEIVTVMVH